MAAAGLGAVAATGSTLGKVLSRGASPSAAPPERDGAWAIEDAVELLSAWRLAADADGICGGPLGRACKTNGTCGSRHGLEAYAFGRCVYPAAPGTFSITCAAFAYCPEGWKDTAGAGQECSATSPCRYASAGCGDETLCMKCGASEVCPGGPPPVE
jgi:hypothetical protein